MTFRRLMTLLAMLLATLGLAALPAGALATEDVDDEEIELVEDGYFDEELCDEDLASDEDEFYEEEDEYFDEEDEYFDENDELSDEDDDELSDEDDLDDELSDDEFFDDCDEQIAETLGPVGQIVKPVVKRGVVSAQLYLPGKGRITSVLTKGARKGKASAAKRVVLGRAHQKVATAGKVAITIKLTKKGRKALRKAHGKLPLTLTAKVKLATGQQITRVEHLTA